ncbi:MAG: hypothetical protein RLY86_4266 [Pseudomonadota bacterium]
MNDQLPNGWTEATPVELASTEPNALAIGPFGSNLKVPDYRNAGVPLVFVRNIVRREFGGDSSRYVTEQKAKELKAHRVLPGDLLITKMGAPPGDVAVYPKSAPPAIITADCIRFACNQTVTSAEYLEYAMQSPRVRSQFTEITQGVAQLKVSLGRFSTIRIPVSPIREQERIVAALDERLSELDASVAALERAESNLVRYRAAVLASACSGRLVPTEADLARREGRSYEPADQLLARILAERRKANTKAKYEEPAQPNTSKLPKLPEGWVWACLDQILAEPLSNGRSVPDATDGFPVLRLTAIRGGAIDLREHKIGMWNEDEARPFLVKAGDILLSRGNGTLALVGRGGVVPDDPIPVAFPDTMIRVRRSASVDRGYLAMLWNSPLVRTQIEKEARTTAGIYKVNQQILEGICLPLPPAAEQSRIVAEVDRHLSRADALAASIAQAKRRAQRLRRAILAAAFQGRLVPQDPHDEPASVLLERIRAQAAAAPAAAPRRGRPPAPARAAEAAATYDAPAPKRRGRPPGSKNKAKA